ncbi:hypothetical protein OSB04_022586 [Centaurea solstitialis]|uniref:soluble epoxide hydrolase n=1 Tax=Centaurea solstitialis TaxID=347529 RepID=A0AA38TGA1_9ASTR|nr:hypothetical protein OSB04_022586 [Centaurea solstitialis]
MEGIQHKWVRANGLNIHIAEKGEGPLVLFVHGFPELWYSWRHQILYLADHGYREVALDLRGYGDTTGAPVDDPTKFTIHHLVGDLIGLLDAITNQEEKVFVVGHDWGANIAWHLCMFRPDRVKALVNLSVPFMPWNPKGDTIQILRAVYGEDHYIVRFQEPGDIEAELARIDTKTVIKKFLTFRNPEPFYFPKGKGFKHSPNDATVTLPTWLSEEDVEYFATRLDKNGISGAINYYRAFLLNWELSSPWHGAKVTVPTKFVIGDMDLVYYMPGMKEYIHHGGFQADVPLLKEVVVIKIKMEGIQHKWVRANGLNIHIAEKGEGPLVLFVHGFPELWYSWRHQILYLADHGYRAVAPDLRGYGDTTGAPVDDPTKFTIHHLVGDLIGILDAITEQDEKVFVVGHDWGAIIAWHLCMFRPDRVKALVNMSNPFMPSNLKGDTIQMLRTVYGEDHYIVRFQEPGDIEAELASIDTKTVIKKFLTFRNPEPFYFPKGKGFKHSPNDATVTLPTWLSEEDVEYYATRLDKNGISGPINYYRALLLNWELSSAWLGAKVTVPSKFVIGDLDLVYHMPGMKEYIHNGGFQTDVPLLEEVVVIKGAAHFINQEKHDDINKHIIEFLKKF